MSKEHGRLIRNRSFICLQGRHLRVCFQGSAAYLITIIITLMFSNRGLVKQIRVHPWYMMQPLN